VDTGFTNSPDRSMSTSNTHPAQALLDPFAFHPSTFATDRRANDIKDAATATVPGLSSARSGQPGRNRLRIVI
jgi:hypothetical protein